MEKKYSFLQRLTSGVPTCFRWVQGFAASLSALGGALCAIPNLNPKIATIAAGLIPSGLAVAAVCQFIVKETESTTQSS